MITHWKIEREAGLLEGWVLMTTMHLCVVGLSSCSFFSGWPPVLRAFCSLYLSVHLPLVTSEFCISGVASGAESGFSRYSRTVVRWGLSLPPSEEPLLQCGAVRLQFIFLFVCIHSTLLLYIHWTLSSRMVGTMTVLLVVVSLSLGKSSGRS